METLYKYVLGQAKDAFAGAGVHQFDNNSASLNHEQGRLEAYKDVLNRMKELGFTPRVDVSPP